MNEKELKKLILTKIIIKPNRLLMLKAFSLISLIIFMIILSLNLNSIFLKIIIGWIIGYLWGCNALFVHELMHGSVIKSKKIQNLYALLSYSTYFQTPTFWRYWHNYLHHTNTNVPYKDPDYVIKPNGNSNIYSIFYKLLPESKSFFSYFYIFYWMNFQSLLGHLLLRFTKGKWKKINNKKINLEMIVQLFILIIYIKYVGSKNIISLIIIPFFAQNYILMSNIITNHYQKKDANNHVFLETTTSLKVNKIVEFLTFNFNFHTEHHLFPQAPSSCLKKIHKELIKDPNYQYEKKTDVIKKIYSIDR